MIFRKLGLWFIKLYLFQKDLLCLKVLFPHSKSRDETLLGNSFVEISSCHVTYAHKLLNDKIPLRISRGLCWQKQKVQEKVLFFWQWLRSLVSNHVLYSHSPWVAYWPLTTNPAYRIKTCGKPNASHFSKGFRVTTTNVVLHFFFFCSAGLLAFLWYSSSCFQDSCLTSQLVEQKKYTRDSCLIASSSWIGSAVWYFFFTLFRRNSQEFSLQREVKE